MEKQFNLALAVLLLLLTGSRTASAQDDYTLFRDGAKEASVLYRGHKAFEHNFLFNGTYFWESPEYKAGNVVYCGKEYRDVALNIDAVRQDLIVRFNGVSPKVLEREYVQEFSIGERPFLNLQYVYGAQAPSGYWEVLHDGNMKIVRRVVKRLEEDIDGTKRDQTRYAGPFRNDIYKAFVYTETVCCVDADGNIIPIRNRRDMLRMVDKSQRSDVRRHIRRMENADRMPFDRYCVEVTRYLESR